MKKRINLPIACNNCGNRFHWSDAKEVYDPDPMDFDKIKPTGPGCPKCSYNVSMRQLKYNQKWLDRFARAAALEHIPGKVHCCPVMVWGIKGGFILLYKFDARLGVVEAATRFDEQLVKSGFTSISKTWIRSEFVVIRNDSLSGEGRARGGVDKGRIMVHFDGSCLHWTPVMDWIQVAPQQIKDEDKDTLV